MSAVPMNFESQPLDMNLWSQNHLARVEQALSQWVGDGAPAGLGDAMRYALIATVTSVLGGVFGWAIGVWAFDAIARPLLEFYGKTAAFEALKSATGTWAILTMLVTSGMTHIPPMKVVTILSGVVSFDLKWFIASAIVARGGRANWHLISECACAA